MPHIHDIMMMLVDKTAFGKIDLIRAYQQIPDTPKTAATTPIAPKRYNNNKYLMLASMKCFS
ncbi:hypothetical protein T4D_4937 [Trichinella pseudospiralis]|uniref:Uncharacterized protein n=1 Tax=Trichinella pseudospiralis TaxID=6337 RepID=A0A0V1F4E4_TRIPS|nr:hypothetical protein T4D_4937 [Trichinella pseudospiralis]